jgi:HD-GYP domain-containing protein (c-di-GMP phosphodiesterase class II)
MSESTPLRILCIGLEPKVEQIIDGVCEGADFTRVISIDDFVNSFDQWQDDSFSAVFCGSSLEGMAGSEIAQVLLNQCPSIIKYFVTISGERYEPRLLVKNGFTGAFMLPIDLSLLRKAIHENIIPLKAKTRAFRTVKLVDIEADEPLAFDTYLFLPRNNKHIRYTGANQLVEKQKLEKLETRQMNTLWVDHRDMSKFYQYSAKKLRQLGEGAASSTEKAEKLKGSIRGLFNDIFDVSVKADFEQGRETVKQCESIISNYITKGATSNWYKKLLSSIGEAGDGYHHASAVSTFAALFAIGLGHQHPEDLAMAGLFHDLGISQLPADLQEQDPFEMNDDERALFYTHPERSIAMIKNKRIIIPEVVEKAILMHHEYWNGMGWPKRLVGARISEEAQLLLFADQFDYYTRFREGHSRLTPLAAFDEIRRSGAVNVGLLSQLRRLLENNVSSTKSA